jgi:hypothetical protein
VDLQNWPHQNFIIQKKKEEEAEKEEISVQCSDILCEDMFLKTLHSSRQDFS